MLTSVYSATYVKSYRCIVETSRHPYQWILSPLLTWTDPPPSPEAVRNSPALISGLVTKIPGTIFVVEKSLWYEHVWIFVFRLIMANCPCIGKNHRVFGNDMVTVCIVFCYGMGNASWYNGTPAQDLDSNLVHGLVPGRKGMQGL